MLAPGPSRFPVVGWRGNVLQYFADPLGTMRRLHETHGDVVSLCRDGNQPLLFRPSQGIARTVFAFGPAAVKDVLKQPHRFESGELRGPRECKWLTDNMSSANGDARSAQRRIHTPAFARPRICVYHSSMVRHAHRFVDECLQHQRVDIAARLEEMCGNVVSEVIFGQASVADGETLASMARDVVTGLFSPLTMLPLRFPGSPYQRFLDLTARAGDAVLREIRSREHSGLAGDDAFTLMLGTMRSLGIHVNEHQLMGNVLALYSASHDVPANALMWTLYLLAQHPMAAADLHDEIESGFTGEPDDVDRLFALPHLDGVVKESLRLLCPAVLVWRTATAPCELGGYEIARGTEVLISPFTTQRSSSWFERPREFVPGRWRTLTPVPFSYIPFSFGFRKCLGEHFALNWLKITIAIVMRRMRLAVSPEARIGTRVTLTLRPKPGLPMLAIAQDRQFDRSPASIRGSLADLVAAE